MTQEISKIEAVEFVPSEYDEMVDGLRAICRKIGIFISDYDYAKFLLEMPVADRLGWLSDNLYATMASDAIATVQDYLDMSACLNMLY